MDPGTALGVVSLGIQVCEGLLDYYRDWRSYEQDVAETYRYIARLEGAFKLVQSSTATPANAGPPADLNLQEALASCRAGNDELQKKLSKIHLKSPNDLRDKAKARLLRLSYPFKKSTLEKLKETVEDISQHLDIAMQILQLDVANAVHMQLSNVSGRLDMISSMAERIDANAASTVALLSEADTKIADVLAQEEETKGKVAALVTAKGMERMSATLLWLGAPDSSFDHNNARNKHEPNTGEWFLRSKEYESWLQGKNNHLWVYGKLVAWQQAKLRGSAHLSDRPGDSGQLNIRLRFKPKKKVDTIEGILMEVMGEDRHHYIIIDALDECPESGDRRSVLLERIQGLMHRRPNLHILMTSRRETDIEEALHSQPTLKVAVDSSAVDNDISVYVQGLLKRDPRLRKLPSELKTKIQMTIAEKSDGIDFQQDVIKALQWISFSMTPLTVEMLVEACVISATDKPHVDVDSREAMYSIIDVLSSLITVVPGAGYVSVDPFQDEDGLSATYTRTLQGNGSAGLSDSELDLFRKRTVQLAHFSVKEYLTSSRTPGLGQSVINRFYLDAARCNYSLAQDCAAYLIHHIVDEDDQGLTKAADTIANDLTSRSKLDPDMIEKTRSEQVMLSSCRCYWHAHVRSAERSGIPDDIHPLHIDMLEDYRLRVDLYHGYRVIAPKGYQKWKPKDFTASALHIATIQNLPATVKEPLHRGADINATGGFQGTALQVACSVNNARLVRLLPDRGADPHIEAGCHGTALLTTCMEGRQGSEDMFDTLDAILSALECLPSQEQLDRILAHACSLGSEEMAKRMLDLGASINALGSSPVLQACISGHQHLLKLLLDTGTSVQVGTQPLLPTALDFDQVATCKLLLDHGQGSTLIDRRIVLDPIDPTTSIAARRFTITQILEDKCMDLRVVRRLADGMEWSLADIERDQSFREDDWYEEIMRTPYRFAKEHQLQEVIAAFVYAITWRYENFTALYEGNGRSITIIDWKGFPIPPEDGREHYERWEFPFAWYSCLMAWG